MFTVEVNGKRTSTTYGEESEAVRKAQELAQLKGTRQVRVNRVSINWKSEGVHKDDFYINEACVFHSGTARVRKA